MTNDANTVPTDLLPESSKQQTAKNAAKILADKGIGFVIPTPKQKRILLVEFAKRNLVVYGKAFDILKATEPINLDDADDVAKHLDAVVLYEIKSTNKQEVGSDFEKYFFALTTAKLLVAQNLKSRYMFIFVNTLTRKHRELTLSEVFAKAKAIYPTWSIMF
jgi:hypothetical protein